VTQVTWLYQQVRVKVKCTLVQALRLCTGRTAHRESRGIALFFHDHGTRRGWGASVTPRPLFTPGKDPVPIVQKAGWAPGPKNLVPTGIRSPDRPGCSQSPYRLNYPALFTNRTFYKTNTHKRWFSISLTLILLTWSIWWANNASKCQMEFKSAFKRLMLQTNCFRTRLVSWSTVFRTDR
jgi:hypothetical protein